MSYSYYIINSNVNITTDGLEYYNYFFIYASNFDITIILPVSYDSAFYQFQRIDQTYSNNVEIIPNSGDTINNSSSINLSIKKYVQIIKVNSNWLAPVISVD